MVLFVEIGVCDCDVFVQWLCDVNQMIYVCFVLIVFVYCMYLVVCVLIVQVGDEIGKMIDVFDLQYVLLVVLCGGLVDVFVLVVLVWYVVWLCVLFDDLVYGVLWFVFQVLWVVEGV